MGLAYKSVQQAWHPCGQHEQGRSMQSWQLQLNEWASIARQQHGFSGSAVCVLGTVRQLVGGAQHLVTTG
jgi:hypothetical protein